MRGGWHSVSESITPSPHGTTFAAPRTADACLSGPSTGARLHIAGAGRACHRDQSLDLAIRRRPVRIRRARLRISRRSWSSRRTRSSAARSSRNLRHQRQRLIHRTRRESGSRHAIQNHGARRYCHKNTSSKYGFHNVSPYCFYFLHRPGSPAVSKPAAPASLTAPAPAPRLTAIARNSVRHSFQIHPCILYRISFLNSSFLPRVRARKCLWRKVRPAICKSVTNPPGAILTMGRAASLRDTGQVGPGTAQEKARSTKAYNQADAPC